MIERMHHRMREFDMHAPVPRIIRSSLHREQVDAVRAEDDVIDPVQTTLPRRHRQRDRGVLKLLAPGLLAVRQLVDAVQHLLVDLVMWMCRFRQQGIPLGLFHCSQRARADDAVDVQVVGVLEGFDGVKGVGAEMTFDNKRLIEEIAIAERRKFFLKRLQRIFPTLLSIRTVSFFP